MKAFCAIALLLALSVGCTGGSKSGGGEVKDDGVFKVALLTPGSISDSGWNAMAYEGLTAIHDELGVQVDNKQATDAQIKDSMRSYAQKDYDLVVGHGFEYNAPAIEVAKDFPSTVFVSSSGSQTANNVGAFRFYLEQGFYLAGYLAASLSKTGKVAAIGFDKIPSIKSTFRGFEAGAKAANPNITLIEPPMDDKADVAAMKQATLAAIEQGADFVIHQANDKAQGVFDACKEKGVYAFGANLNQNDNPSGVVFASAYIIAKPAYVELAKEVKAGTYTGKVELRGMKDGAIGFEINPRMITKIPTAVLAKIIELQGQIANGALTVPKDDF